MKLKIAQVIGLNTDQKAAQVVSSSRNGESYFFAVLDLTSDDAFTKGRQTLSELSDFYFDFESGSAGEKLNATFKEAKKRFGSGADFSMLLAAISGKVLYLLSQGSVEVYLKRSEKLSSLLSLGAPSQLISGFLETGDKLLLSTSTLVSFLGDDLAKLLELSQETFEEEVTDRIGVSKGENQTLAALLVEIEREEVLSSQDKEMLEQEEIPSLEEEPTAPSQDSKLDSTENLLLRFKTIFRNILDFLWQKRVFLPKSGKSRLSVAVVLIAVIALGIGFRVKSFQDAKREQAFEKALQESRDNFNAAKGLATLNPADTKLKLDGALDKVSLALRIKPDSREAQDFKKQIEQDSGSILQQFEASEFPLFLDLDLVKKNFQASWMSLSVGKLLLLDPNVKTLVLVDLAKKSHQILAGSEQLGDAAFAALNGSLAFVYSKDKGILRVDTAKEKTTQVAKKDSGWGSIVDLYSFAGNVYALDKGNPSASSGQVWKYLPTTEGYSDKREYLSKNTKADFVNIQRMQIESSIYVLKQDGEMLRFTRGDKDNFSYSGLDKGVKDPKSFFVSSDSDNLYLLDSGNSRLLILGKTGIYKGQITGSKFATASDLVVDEKEKKVYLLEGSKIFQVDLK